MLRPQAIQPGDQNGRSTRRPVPLRQDCRAAHPCRVAPRRRPGRSSGSSPASRRARALMPRFNGRTAPPLATGSRPPSPSRVSSWVGSSQGSADLRSRPSDPSTTSSTAFATQPSPPFPVETGRLIEPAPESGQTTVDNGPKEAAPGNRHKHGHCGRPDERLSEARPRRSVFVRSSVDERTLPWPLRKSVVSY